MNCKERRLPTFSLILCVFLCKFFCAAASYRDLSPHKQCPLGYELHFDREARKYECSCKKFHLYWPEDGLCYREYQQGPCQEGHRLVRDEETRQPVCSCPFFSAPFEGDGKCYQEYTRGPCPNGKLFMTDRVTGKGTCGCDPSLKMFYYESTGECFELYHQGPCPEGHQLFFNYSAFAPQCKCTDGFTLYSDGKCYELNTKGPCEAELVGCPGTPCFMKALEATDVQCTCLPKNSLTENNQCYQPYTRGPCQLGEWIVFKEDGSASCEEKKFCQRFDNWHWWEPHQQCYRQFSQGPCENGKLFYLDPETMTTGCFCKPAWRANFWNSTGECFELDSIGPCPLGQYFSYNSKNQSPECSCFKSFVHNLEDDTCVELFTRASCPEGQIVINDGKGSLKCDCGPHMKQHYWPKNGLCYPHYEQGPCLEGEQFRLHPVKNRPACVFWGV